MFSPQDVGSIEKINYENIINTVIYRINTAYANQDNQSYIKNVHCLKDLLSPYFSYYYKNEFNHIAKKREQDLQEYIDSEGVLLESWREVYLRLLKILKNKGLLLKERRGIPLK
jgi:hypothetical protein